MYMKKSFILLAVVVLMSSCLTMIVKTPVPYQENQAIKKIAIFPVLIGEMYQPVIPLIDAAAFNSKTNKIADQIMDAERESIDKMREDLASTISNYFKCEVLYGESLQMTEGYGSLSNSHNFKYALAIEDDDFPVMLIASGDINPFKFKDGRFVTFFKDQMNYKQTVKQLCEKLNVDAIAVNFSRLSIVGVSSFGINGNIRLETFLYVIDKEGEIVGNGYAFSKPVTIRGKELEEYKLRLNDYSPIIQPLVNQLVNGKAK